MIIYGIPSFYSTENKQNDISRFPILLSRRKMALRLYRHKFIFSLKGILCSYAVFSTPFSLLSTGLDIRHSTLDPRLVCCSLFTLCPRNIHLATFRRSYQASALWTTVTKNTYLVPSSLSFPGHNRAIQPLFLLPFSTTCPKAISSCCSWSLLKSIVPFSGLRHLQKRFEIGFKLRSYTCLWIPTCRPLHLRFSCLSWLVLSETAYLIRTFQSISDYTLSIKTHRLVWKDRLLVCKLSYTRDFEKLLLFFRQFESPLRLTIIYST